MFILIFSRRFHVVVRSFINFTDDKSLFTRNGICQNIGKLTVLNYRKDFRINTIQRRVVSEELSESFCTRVNIAVFHLETFIKRWFLSFCSYDYVQDISSENRLSHFWGTTNSFTVYPLGQKKAPFLPDELWEEIKSLIYSESNGGGSTEGDRLGGRHNASNTYFTGHCGGKKGKTMTTHNMAGGRQKHPQWEREWLTKDFCSTFFPPD